MQQPSPALSSPSTGFMGPRVSPLFSSTVEQTSDGGVAVNSSDVLQPSAVVTRSSQDQEKQAPPKKLSQAMEGLQRAHRHIADIRSGADLLLEALEIAVSRRANDSPGKKASDGVTAAVENLRKALDALRATGKELESSGILRGAQQPYDDNQPWGLQPPSVCPDGHVTPYAWKRQIAAQAAASAVERTRLALKSFGEQKKHLFLGDDRRTKKPQAGVEASAEDPSLFDVLRRIQTDASGMLVTPYSRLEWAKRTSCVNIAKAGIDPGQSLAYLSSQTNNIVKLESGTQSTLRGLDAPSRPVEKVAVLEVCIPGVLRAIISLRPTGSVHPDAIAVFSPDEGVQAVDCLGCTVRPFASTNSAPLSPPFSASNRQN